MLDNNASAEKATKTIRMGLLMSLKQHSLKQESTQSCVSSSCVQSSQKLTKLMRNGISRAMHARSVTTVTMRERKPSDCLFRPIRNSRNMASINESIPMTKASRCGSGPLKSTESHVMIVDSSTMEEMR